MTIEWNRVTWYSKAIAVVLFVATFYIGFCLGVRKGELNKSLDSGVDAVLADGKYCFTRSQAATPSEPYAVEEHVSLNVNGNSVTGIKSGTQNGPDMNNGYTGDLKGEIKDGRLEATYSYTVEGSKNKELEIYKLEKTMLTKLRWPLKEENKILVPTKVGEPKLISYVPEQCAN